MLRELIFFTKPARYAMASGTYLLHRRGRKRLQELKDRHKGQPILVVGNGPSLNRTPLDELAGLPSIGMNKINLLFPRVEWRPSYIVSVNSLVIRQNRRFFEETDIPTFLSWKARHFLRPFNRSGIRFLLERPSSEFSRNLPAGVASSDTVTYTALQLAYWLGANPVILVGVDHSFAARGKPNDIRKMEEPDVNHFDANYFAKGSYWGIPNLEGSEEVYRRAKQAFEQDGREILDATIDGKLEIFRKIDIEDVLRMAADNTALDLNRLDDRMRA